MVFVNVAFILKRQFLVKAILEADFCILHEEGHDVFQDVRAYIDLRVIHIDFFRFREFYETENREGVSKFSVLVNQCFNNPWRESFA